nr:CDP-glycerol glycerophosphotransferase family protein [Gordonibacter massiliensis (ex Traore et al. 2017)]
MFIPVDENMVLFSSFSGKRYDDSPKVLFERMLERDDCADLHFVWAFNRPNDYRLPRTQIVKMHSWAYWRAALSAKFWVTNVNIECGLSFKKKQQVYVNTWHGTGNKSFGNLVPGRNDYDFSTVDVFTVDGVFMADMHHRALNVNYASFVYCGRPREDELYLASQSTRREIRDKLGIPENAFVVLYAPTWRDSLTGGNDYSFEALLDADRVLESLGENALILYRAHSIVTETRGISFSERVVDCSVYPNVNELYIAADLLISDYSSVFADYSILGKPMLCFAFDYEDYVLSRGLTADFRDDITTFYNEEDLYSYLCAFSYREESDKTKRFKAKYISAGGNASDACIDAMFAASKSKHD